MFESVARRDVAAYVHSPFSRLTNVTFVTWMPIGILYTDWDLLALHLTYLTDTGHRVQRSWLDDQSPRV